MYSAIAIGWSLLALTVALQGAAVTLSAGREPEYDTALYALVGVLMASAGALVVSRHPRHLVGWLFCVAVVHGSIVEAAQGWGLRDLVGGDWATCFAGWGWITHGIVPDRRASSASS